MRTIKSLALYGVLEAKPLVGFPEGKTKIRMRNNDFVRVFVKTPTAIQQYIPKEVNGEWHPHAKLGANTTI